MSQDGTPQRTVDSDAEGWSPFGGPVQGTTDGTPKADARPSTAEVDATGWRPRVIEGGRGHKDAPGQDAAVDEGAADGPDVIDAAAADALAILDVPDAAEDTSAIEPAPPEPEPAAAIEATTEPADAPTVEAPTAVPEPAVKAPAATTQKPTPHPTLHTPTQATSEAPAPAQEPTEAVETPHSSPWLRTAVGWLNPYEVLDQPLPPVSAIYDAARTTVTDRSGLDRVTEVAWVYCIGMPVTVACYTVAAAVQRKWRGLGTSTLAVLWTVAANSSPVEASTIWFWTAAGYWVSTVLILPAVIQAKK